MSVEAVRVAIRVRPLNERELGTDKAISWTVDRSSLTHRQTERGAPPATYTFDRVFNMKEDSKTVYEEFARPIVQSAMEGINGTIFVYGQTSSGKTHTMMGEESSPGVIPRAIEDIFSCIDKAQDRDFVLRVSFIEIYNENISDLLNSDGQNLKIKETIDGDILIHDLLEPSVCAPEQFFELLDIGIRNRKTAATRMNDHSSRSHSVFRVTIESSPHRETDGDEEGNDEGRSVRVAHLNLVDLAGSERVAHTGAEGQRLKEGASINRSLLTLGIVINKLSEGVTDAVHIPYRDSKLTRILQNSLGGNARTAIICTITPAAMHVDESISTLKFASRAKAIQNKAVVNERVDAKVMMKRMMHEIGQLRERNQLLEDGSELRGLKSKQVALEQALQEAEEQHQEAERKIQNLTRLIINASKVQVANNQPAIEAPALGGTAAEHESINRRRTWTPMEVEISVRRSNAAGGRRMVHVSPASMKRHLRRSMGDSLLPESARRMLTNGSAAGAASATPAAGAAPPGQSAWAGGHTADGISSAALGITETDIFKAKAQKLQQALAAREQGMAALNQRLEETLASLANSTSDMDALRQQLAQAQAQAAELSASRQSHNAEIEELRQQLEQAHTANSDAIGKAQHEYERELREARENIEFLNQELEVYRHSPTASPKASKNGGSVEELQAALALEKEKSELLEDTVSTLTSQQELYESEIQALKEAEQLAVQAHLEANEKLAQNQTDIEQLKQALKEANEALVEAQRSAGVNAEQALHAEMEQVRAAAAQADAARQQAQDESLTLETKLCSIERKLAEAQAELSQYRSVEDAATECLGEHVSAESGGAAARILNMLMQELQCDSLQTFKEQILATSAKLQELEAAAQTSAGAAEEQLAAARAQAKEEAESCLQAKLKQLSNEHAATIASLQQQQIDAATAAERQHGELQEEMQKLQTTYTTQVEELEQKLQDCQVQLADAQAKMSASIEAQASTQQPDMTITDTAADSDAEAEGEELEAMGDENQPPAKSAKRSFLQKLAAASPFRKRRRKLGSKADIASPFSSMEGPTETTRLHALKTPLKAGAAAADLNAENDSDKQKLIAPVLEEEDDDDDEISFGANAQITVQVPAGTLKQLEEQVAELQQQVATAKAELEKQQECTAQALQQSAADSAAREQLEEKLLSTAGTLERLSNAAQSAKTEAAAATQDVAQAKAELAAAQERLMTLEQELQTVSAQLEAERQRAQQLSEQLEQAQAAAGASTQLAELQQQLESQTQALDAAATRARAAEEHCQATELECARISSELEAARAKIVELQNSQQEDLQMALSHAASLEAQLETVQASLAKTQQQLTTANVEREQLQQQVGKLQAEVEAASAAAAAAGTTAAASSSDAAGEAAAQLEQLQQELDEANARIEELETAEGSLVQDLDAAQSLAQTQTSKVEQLMEQLREAQTAAEQAVLAQQQAEATLQQVRLGADQSQTSWNSRLATLQAELEAVQTALSQKDADVRNLLRERQDLDSATQALIQLQEANNQLQEQVETMMREKTSMAAQMEAGRQQLAALEKVAEQARAAQHKAEQEAENLVKTQAICIKMEEQVAALTKENKAKQAECAKLQKKTEKMQTMLKESEDYQAERQAELDSRYQEQLKGMQAREAALAETNAALAAQKQACSELQAKLAALAAEKSHFADAAVQLQAAQQTIASLRMDSNAAQAQIEQLQDKLQDLQKSRGEAARNAPGIVGLDANYSLKEENKRLKEEHVRETQQLKEQVAALEAQLTLVRDKLASEERRCSELSAALASATAENAKRRAPLQATTNNAEGSPARSPAGKRPVISLDAPLATPSNNLYSRAKQEADRLGLRETLGHGMTPIAVMETSTLGAGTALRRDGSTAGTAAAAANLARKPRPVAASTTSQAEAKDGPGECNAQ